MIYQTESHIIDIKVNDVLEKVNCEFNESKKVLEQLKDEKIRLSYELQQEKFNFQDAEDVSFNILF